jgi:hypothetical protein
MRPPKTLISKWYAKLAKAGFADIEEPDGALKRWHSRDFNRPKRSKEQNESATYYQLASDVLNKFSFANAVERQVWELHCQGWGVRRIGWTVGMNKDYVHRIVRRIQQETCLKK